MSFNKSFIEQTLSGLDFSLISGQTSCWQKEYTKHGSYTIIVDLSNDELSKCKINYGDDIAKGRETTCNFSQRENLVVLECVDRLLMKGYAPPQIELEKRWRVGGYLDILVKDTTDKAYIMIDCKVWGEPYNSAEKIIMTNDYNKEQLFNYYLNDKNAKFVVLYTSNLTNNGIRYKSNIIEMSRFISCKNQKEIYENWDKNFQIKGIFDEDSTPYNVKFSGIKQKDLQPLSIYDVDKFDKNIDGTIFNTFAEILRRNVISDKNNAYNVIFNLILSKIVDEDQAVDEDYEMEFQWKFDEEPVQVLERLSKLYRTGVTDYLDIELVELSEEVDQVLARIPHDLNHVSKEIRDLFKQFRIYKSSEFAFKEILDERTFKENAEIVKSVVKLLEKYELKGTHKQPFLGYFFEKLLNIGMKQETGQFFTALPIAEFNSRSIPYEKIIKDKIERREEFFLPYLIDYACGSGHFLTEGIERIDEVLQRLTDKDLKSRRQIDRLSGWQTSFNWTREFVYGIEKDFRLVKTSKIACFLNGEGDVNILYADGLDKFDSDKYRGKLLASKNIDNGNFDVLEANPPYSVENFKLTIQDSQDSFELFDEVSDKSDDIECLFIERAKHLLREGGYASLILPATILLNSGIHSKARKLMLKYFKVVGIVEFGTQTFLATGQRTVNLFMIRRSNDEWKMAENIAKEFLDNLKPGKKSDFDYANNKSIFSEYLNLLSDEIDLDEYINTLTDKKHFDTEVEKLMFFMLTYNNKIVVANSKDKEDELMFLGYEHSDRRKYEGIHPYPNNKDRKINSMLYDENSLNNIEKVSTYIYKNYLGEDLPEIHSNLVKHVKIEMLHEMLDLSSDRFIAKIFIEALENIYLSTDKYPIESLENEDMVEILDYMRKPVKKSDRTSGDIPYYGASGVVGKITDYIFDEDLVLIGEDGARWDEFKETAYKVEGKSWVNNHAHVIRVNKNILKEEFLVEIFNRLDFSYLKRRPNGGKLLQSELKKIKFPVPPIQVQEQILKKMQGKKEKERYKIFDEELGIN
ncbi:adenine-specific N6 DNA methylase [Gottschalkia acidurici 9a]|uniref:site-specific DNA-methyltransferase (adenine-specific) n=1 Tax=Gottschalkia acidurici (strain ATCC 7906 / DSM 604 / BCRC 14475 / CIP 104303 / KCTC 5404 / NCIMB 10678 / 9a) TaxID=1128398 RepID=K0B3V9_GOTA9|nr:restriction endonuclease subunit S [Gottschalkia acidurici]AFS79817.1 adenine-specific N6 DNA methylase [Gottschalkia acidurici 9a]